LLQGNFQGNITLHDLDVIVRQTDDLPAMPAAVWRVLELTAPEVAGVSDLPDVIDEVIRVLSADVALAARLIWMANASGGRAVRTVSAAVKVLGIEAVRAAVLSNKVCELIGGAETAKSGPVRRRHNGHGLDCRALWRHSLVVAWAARLLAERLDMPIDGEEAHLAGLMHDIGKLLLSESLPKSYARAVAAAADHNGSLAEWEKKTLGVDHLVAGRRLAQCWRLGSSIENAAWLHHQPSEAIPACVPDAGIVRVVALANGLANRKLIGSCGSPAANQICEGMMRALGLGEADMSAIAAKLDEQLERNADLLALADAAAAGPRTDWLAEANAELGRLNSRLGRQERKLSVQAEALAGLIDFTAGLSAESSLPDVLLKLAETFGHCLAGTAARAAAVVAYSLDERTRTMLAVRLAARPGGTSGDCRPQWRTFALAGGGHSLAAPDHLAAPAEALTTLLGGTDAWAGWVDLASSRHVPLASGGRWLGGVICPADDSGAAGQDAMAPALALSLGLVQRRNVADAMSEELAGASQLLAETREALAEAKTLAALGDLAAGAGHELNTPLAVVSGRAQLMRDKAEMPEDRRTWQTIVDQAQRISDIITGLMDFASPPAPKIGPVSAGKLLSESANAFSSSEHPQAAARGVDIQVEDGVPRIQADGGQVKAVLLELLANAASAVGADGLIVLSASADDSRRHVLLKVRDNGSGMDAATLARAFTPFYSAQKAGRRRGLGLPKAKRYVENNGGRMWIDSEPGKGTVVSIQLPADQREVLEGEVNHGKPQDDQSTGS
jgi:signal transduction histidine kinase/HD-like signal output (HDOD) protein